MFNRKSWWIIAIVIVGCGEGLGGLLISDQQELEIGTEVDLQIEQQFEIVATSDPVSLWAQQLLAPIEQASAFRRDPANVGGYKIEVINDDQLVNAFAAPGGFTYITTALILEASSCAEIAGVMGHELAHVTERHSVKKIEDQFAATELAAIFLGDGLAGQVASQIYIFLSETQFTQDAEEEADFYGVQIVAGAGYNPYGLVDFFERLLELERQAGFTVPEFLSSHPATEDRVRDVSNTIQQLYGEQIVRGKGQYGCVGTQLTLAQVQEEIRNGVTIRPNTGTLKDSE